MSNSCYFKAVIFLANRKKTWSRIQGGCELGQLIQYLVAMIEAAI